MEIFHVGNLIASQFVEWNTANKPNCRECMRVEVAQSLKQNTAFKQDTLAVIIVVSTNVGEILSHCRQWQNIVTAFYGTDKPVQMY